MVKYHGESGARVGKYRSSKLGASFSTKEFLDKWGDNPVFASPAKDMDAYLSRAGSFVDIETHIGKDAIRGSYVYHYGGATVAVKYTFYSELLDGEETGNITVRLASNDPLDQITKKLVNKFPYLQEGKSFDGRG
jgi:hypothetical protein